MDNRLYSTECSTADYIRNKNVFSIRYYYEKITVPLEYITLNIGELEFQIYGKRIVFSDNHSKVKIAYHQEPLFNLLNFRNSHNYLFISKYSSDHHNHLNNFIKIGMGYLTRSNVIIEIIAKNKEGTF